MPAIASKDRVRIPRPRAWQRLKAWAMRDRPPRRRPRWMPRPTVRLRLTMLYGTLFLIAGAGLLAITYALVAQDTTTSAASIAVRSPLGFQQAPDNLFIASQALTFDRARAQAFGPSQVHISKTFSRPPGVVGGNGRYVNTLAVGPGLPRRLLIALRAYEKDLAGAARQLNATAKASVRQLRAGVRQVKAQAQIVVKHAKRAQLDALLTRSGLALAIMALLSIALGWLMAGRALAPVRTMNNRVRRISEDNLHERVALKGRDDELKELADNFDGLLERLQRAFDSQRLFVANASHELRTPVTVERALIEVALADPNPSLDSLRETLGRVLVAGEHQERTIEALLTLARSQRGLESREQVDLAAVAAGVVGEAHPDGIELSTDFEPAATLGDKALVERLIANLLTNALEHNIEHGWVRASTVSIDGHATLMVENSGAVIDPADAARLVEPFRRLNGNRTGHTGAGTGLGLSIVDAIATAHGAELEIHARDGGGLVVSVGFPPA
jgi:signal transduction histidine kinase